MRRARAAAAALLAASVIAAPSYAAPTLSVSPDALKPSSVTPAPQRIAPIRPDLAIERIAVDNSCRVAITVVNRGPGTVPDSVWTAKSPSSSSVYLHAAGRPWGGKTIWLFDSARKLQRAGGTASLTLNYTVSGNVSVRVTVDHTAQVQEGDESNNERTTTLSCGTTTPPTVLRDAVSPVGERVTRPAEDTFEEDAGEPSPGDGGTSAAPAMPRASGGGSLLESQLPPPPQDLPAPPKREDRSVEPAELVVASASMAEAQALASTARTLGFGVKRRSNLQGLGLVVTVLRVPRDTGVGAALAALRQAAPSVWADANHRYALQGDNAALYARTLIGWESGALDCGKGVRIGMLDTALEREHPTLKGRDIVTHSVLATGIPRAKPQHGTAVAALLIGNPLPSGFRGLVPGAKLYAAEIFRAHGDEAETTAEWIVAALNWLAVQKVDVVNLSLGGPRNLLLEAALTRLMALGTVIVAAGGNGGADAAPVYPAAQPGVVAVTAVDAELKPFRKATRGAYLALAAPGVDIWSASAGGDGKYYSGTSYAAPFVTAALAALRQARPKTAGATLVQQAQRQARDLGDPGRDPVYGWGLVQSPGCAAAPSAARR